VENDLKNNLIIYHGMRLFSVATLLLGIVSGCSEVGRVEKYLRWMADYGIQDEVGMFEKWVDNDNYIAEVNARNGTHQLGHNHLSGMDVVDYTRFLGYNGKREVRLNAVRAREVGDLAASVDWVSAGAVTPVKDQGQCGSCWSFSTTGALEGAYFVKNGKLVSFSEQQLVDCDNFRNGGRDQGCNGGLMDNAFAWITKNGGLCLESDYKYESGVSQTEGTCEKSCSVVSGSKIAKYVDVPVSDDAQMMAALMVQPVAIAIEADQRDFQLYKSGVFTGACGTNLDHGVLAVGYGVENGSDYYMVKNSWGTTWGDGGYIKLGRGKTYNGGDGQCGMLLSASYPVL
jgi:C1A family cysteine protease